MVGSLIWVSNPQTCINGLHSVIFVDYRGIRNTGCVKRETGVTDSVLKQDPNTSTVKTEERQFTITVQNMGEFSGKHGTEHTTTETG